MRSLERLVLAFVLVAVPAFAQQRLATDFEIAQMEKQIAQARGFEAQFGARMNLGDARAARSEVSLARQEFMKARDLAAAERLDARMDADLSRYADATSWAAVAAARLGQRAEAFALAEEAVRYVSDDAKAWNLYASAMRSAGFTRKAVAAARNAVAVASTAPDKPLDFAVYRHALAMALLDSGESAEAEMLLRSVVEALASPALEKPRRDAVRSESFEVYSAPMGDAAAYVSLLSRSQLTLASLAEDRGNVAEARVWYRKALDVRSDDVAALNALARLAASDAERERLYAEAFDANPFSPTLVRDYRERIALEMPEIDGNSIGSRVRRALVHLDKGEMRAARASFDALLREFPSNETLRALRAEAEGSSTVVLPSPSPSAAELRGLLDSFERITAAQRATLDRSTLRSSVTFTGATARDGATVLHEGTIEGVPFRFTAPTAFAGTFDANRPLLLTYRILGVTKRDDHDVLLLEPLKVERNP